MLAFNNIRMDINLITKYLNNLTMFSYPRQECSVVDPAKVQSMILITKTHRTDAHRSDTYV